MFSFSFSFVQEVAILRYSQKKRDSCRLLTTKVSPLSHEPDSVWQERIEALQPYQVNKAMMDNAGEQCRFMHCLPAFHDLKTTIGKQIYDKFGLTCMEVTDEVFESSQSIVFDEAENRLHTIKAVMAATLAD
jgi:ornithine carbamoyltransferase